MKKICFSLLTVVFSLQLSGQVTSKYHLVRWVNPDEANTVSNFCNNGIIQAVGERRLNILIEDKLPVNTVFVAQLSTVPSGYKYFIVVESSDSPISNPDVTITDFANTCEIVDFCAGNLKTYKRHRIYYLGASISGLETLYCQYLQSPPSGNGTKVNIFRSTPLATNKVYYFAAGSGVQEGYYYVGYSGYTRDPDEDSNVHDYTLISRIDLADSDYDGVPNICDDCATQSGPPSNGGCPLPPADLSLNPASTFVTSNCTNCPSLLGDLGNKRYEIARNGGGMTVSAYIRNTGQQASGSYTIKVYLSSDATLSSNDFNFYSSTVSASPISAGGTDQESIYVYGSQFEYNQAYGNYYVLIVLDANNVVPEGNENNNLTAIPILFKQNF
ncbi:CARDB domain-containing protein [Parapedobacter sp. DT-150]|uniref:CARDB domain-containing protein n=1 Tax=Parapedobacter sp. DT-150 TaxID=3396162 RepID=UPI003F1C48CE